MVSDNNLDLVVEESPATRSPALRVQPLRLCHVRPRQPEAESRAAARPGFEPHVAAVLDHRLAREREPDAETVAFAGRDKGLEELRTDLGRDAGAVVLDMRDHRIAL